MNKYEVTFHCDGEDETDTVFAASKEEAQKQVEDTFPKGKGWYVKDVKLVSGVEPVAAVVATHGAKKSHRSTVGA